MTQQQTFQACVELAPNFRIGIEYPIVGRSIIWRGTPRGSMTELSAGLTFPDDAVFEPRFTALLQQALVTLRQAV